ncbi:MAG: TonB-dependent receptor [Novosphingobium sp.]
MAPNNEIIVSARRRDESVQDVPSTVNVVTAAQVEKLNLRNFTEISSVVPGLQLTAVSSFNNSATVRGIAFEPTASGNNPSIEFYLNDAPIASGFLFQSTFDFGQFELQRGPQGTLRGRASPSGSIAVTTRRPDLSEPGVVLNGTVTNLRAHKLDGAFNIPIIKDVLAVRIAGVIDNNRGNFVSTIKEQSDPNFNQRAFGRVEGIRGSVRFEPTEWATINFMAQKLHSETHRLTQVVSNSLFVTGAPQTGQLIRPFDRLGIEDVGPYDRQDLQVYVGNVDIRFAGQRLSYVGSYSKQSLGNLGPQDPGDFFAPPRIATTGRAFVDPPGFAPVCANEASILTVAPNTGSYYQCTTSLAKRKAHELRLASDARIGGIFDYVVGLFYDHNNNPSDLTSETPLVIQTSAAPNYVVAAVSPTAIQRRGTSTEKSAFGNVVAHLLDDKLELSGGLRYIDYRNQNTLALASAPSFALNIASRDAQQIHKTIYTGSIKYKITPDIMVYALTGSSFRPGPRVVGDFSRGPLGTGQTALEQQYTILPAETSKSYEIGAKTSFLNGRGRLNISAYHQTFKNYPFRGPPVFYLNYSIAGGVLTPAVSTFNFVSAVPVTVNGVEGEASFQIMDRWSLGVNASYADGKIKGGTIACTDLNGDGRPDLNPATPSLAQLQAAVGAGNALSQCTGINRRSAQSPKFSANIQSEFGFDITSSMDGFVRGLYAFNGKTVNDPDNVFDNVGSYGLLNLYAGIRDKDGAWEITLFGKNILRERQILNVGGTQLSTTYRQLTPPTFRVPVTNSFVSEYRDISVTAPREFGVNLRVAFGSH